jgi:hypothetical protein
MIEAPRLPLIGRRSMLRSRTGLAALTVFSSWSAGTGQAAYVADLRPDKIRASGFGCAGPIRCNVFRSI